MRNLFRAGIVMLVLAAGCRHQSEEPQVLPPGSFWAQRATDDSWYAVRTGEALASAAHCEVYVAQDQQGRWKSRAQSVADEFESKVYGLIVDNFGPPGDVDGNGKITILLMDIQDGYATSESYVAGYFQPYHCLSGPNYPKSNNADMIFMDTNPGVPGDETFNMTLAHEFQHLVNFNRTFLNEDKKKQFDTWINEGLSSAAEYLYLNRHVEGKIDHYKNDSDEDIRKGVNFVTWTPSRAKDDYSSYSTVYLFFQWLRIQTDRSVYKRIFESASMSAEAIPNAAGSVLGNGWPEILVNWFVANARCENSGIYGYKNEISGLQGSWTPKTVGGARDLYPGEGVYVAKSEVDGHTGDTAGNLRYALINSIDTGDTGRGVIVNINGNTRGEPVHVTLAGIAEEKQASAPGAKSLSAPPSPPAEPRPIDRVFRLPE